MNIDKARLRISERELKERLKNRCGKPRNLTYKEQAYKRDRAERRKFARYKLREFQKEFNRKKFPETKQVTLNFKEPKRNE